MLRSATSVDPELLRAGIATALDENSRVLVEAVVTRAVTVMAQANSVDLTTIERQITTRSAAELWAMCEGALLQVWLGVEQLQASLLPLVECHEAAATLDRSLEVVFMRIAETAWTMKFVLANDLGAFRQRLPALLKLKDGWTLLSAMQEHMAHLHAALCAILYGIFECLPDAARAPLQAENAQLAIARELRARIFALREEVTRLEAELHALPPSCWAAPLSELVRQVSDFLHTPAFAWMRANDKSSFLTQHRALSELLALWSPLRAEPGKLAVTGLARFLEALEVINHRECLRKHDRDALRRVVQNLAVSDREPRELVAGALAALAETQGRDRKLDALLQQTLDPCASPDLSAILKRAREVLVELGDAAAPQVKI